jgi:hypothetical protein
VTLRTRKIIAMVLVFGSVAAGPATMPAGELAERIDALVEQLDDPNPPTRESATAQLIAIGPPAIGAVETATRAQAPEARVRAAIVLREIAAAPAFRVHIQGDIKIVDVREPRRCVHIRRDSAGIEVTIDRVRDQNWVRSTTRAPTPQTLQRDLPAYLAYVRFGGGAGASWVYLNVHTSSDFELAAPVDSGNPRDIGRYIDLLFQQMQSARTPEVDQRQVLGMIEQMLTLRDDDAEPSIARREALDAEYLRRSDALRERLADLHLPDPGEVLPIPAKYRLGIALYPNPSAESQGLVVTEVMPDSRARRIGLRPGDVVRAVDGKPAASVDDVRHAMVQATGPVHIQIERGGTPMRLNEPAADAKGAAK